VEDLLDPGIGHERRQRREVPERQRIEQSHGEAGGGQLEEADLLEVVVEVVRLRVEGEGAGAVELADERGEVLRRADPAVRVDDGSRIGAIPRPVKGPGVTRVAVSFPMIHGK
jgi:hypothetical protein